MTIRFDDAWSAAHVLGTEVGESGRDVLLVRDMVGRVSLVVDDVARPVPDDEYGSLTARAEADLGPFASTAPIVRASTLYSRDEILNNPDVTTLTPRSEHRGRLAVLERSAVGADWERVSDSPPVRRVALYGYKGGVGRSIASAMLAKYLAVQGRCVLVVDLDLESPGIGSILQDEDELPDHGVVDHLVESAVGNSAGLDLVARSRWVKGEGNGEVWLSSARGRPRPGYDYLAKLDRAYVDATPLGSTESRTFGRRLAGAIDAAEEQVTGRSRRPDVVLLDTRSGIHDVAGVALTQLSDLNLLFAGDNRQTWSGYRDLFARWAGSNNAHIIRDRLKMVATMVPTTGRDEYLDRFGDRAQQTFAETLYDDILPGGDLDAYNPAPDDRTAPHWPIPILFVPELVGLDVSTRREWHRSDIVAAAYNEFLETAEELVLGGSDG